jgi:hypothetical protein
MIVAIPSGAVTYEKGPTWLPDVGRRTSVQNGFPTSMYRMCYI